MTATPLPADRELPPFGIYRATTAHWSDGTIKLIYAKIKGQGRQVLIEELPGEDPVELGNKYQLTLVRIEDGEPVPPIEMPGFPVLPEPPIAELPVKPEQPIYRPEYPVKPEQPIYRPEYPGAKPMPPIYEKPYPPVGVEPPIYTPGEEPKPEPQ
jgi:hypothetical protein